MKQQRNLKNNQLSHSIVELMLLDHKEVKKYCETLVSNKFQKKEILKLSKVFLYRILYQMIAEEKSLYKSLSSIKKFRNIAEEAMFEHQLLKSQIRKLNQKIQGLKSLGDSELIELRVIAKFYLNHLFFEEGEILPRIASEADRSDIFDWGNRYYQLRRDDVEKLGPYPVLKDEIVNWKDSVQKISAQLLSQMDFQVNQLKH